MELYITLHFKRINNILLLCYEKYNGRVTLVYKVMVLEAIIITFDKNLCVYHVKFYTAMINTFLNVIKRLRLVYLVGTGTTLTGYSG